MFLLLSLPCHVTRHWIKYEDSPESREESPGHFLDQLDALCPELKGHVCVLLLLQGILQFSHRQCSFQVQSSLELVPKKLLFEGSHAFECRTLL